jgi:hypothetical protein
MPALASALLLIAYALRAFRLDYQSLWWDETYSVDVARHGPPAIVSQARADPLPHFFALWAWMNGAGHSEYAVRYLSLLLGLLALPLLYRLVRELGCRRAAMLAAAGLAVSGLGVYYSQEARLHMLGLVLVLAAACALGQAVRTNRPAAWAGYGALAAAALYSHYYAALALLGLNLPLLWWQKARGEPGWWLANGCAVLAFAPWAAVAAGRFGSGMAGQTTGNPAPGPGQFIADTSSFLLFGRTADPQVSIGPALFGLALLLVACRLVVRKGGPRGWMLAGYALLPPAGSYAVAVALPGTYDVRYSLLALPAWLALLALGVNQVLRAARRGPSAPFPHSRTARERSAYALIADRDPPRRERVAGGRQRRRAGARAALTFGMALASMAFVIPTAWALARNYAEPTAARDDYRAAFSAVRRRALPSDVLLYDSPVQVSAVDYYFADRPIATATVPLDASQAALAGELAGLQRQHQGIWLLLALDRRHAVEQWLDSFATPVSNQWFGGGLRLKHYLPAPKPLRDATLPDGDAVHADTGPLRLEAVGLPRQTPSGSLPVALLWTANRPPATDLSVSLQLFGPGGARIAQLDRPPLQGALPTSRWQPGEAYVDELRLPLPNDSLASGLYRLEATAYGPGQPAAPLTTVATLAISGSWQQLPLNAASAAGWRIDAARVGRDSGGNLIVHEEVSVQRPPDADYTWFVHLLDAQGGLVAQDDHPPLTPSSRWQAGDRVALDFTLGAPAAAGETLELGAYSASGQRVQFTEQDGSRTDAPRVPLP